MTDTELAWLSGILEGEGSFSHPPPSAPNRPRIAIEMTDKDVVEHVAKLFGVTYIHHIKHPVETKWKPSYRVEFRGQKAVKLMKRLRPYMGDRRRTRIDEIIFNYIEKPADVAKLNDDAVRDIRTKRISMRKFAELYFVAKGTIQRVQQRDYYKHVS